MIKALDVRKILSILVVLSFCLGCNEPQAGEKKFESILTFAYQRIGYTKLGKDYPSKELLETWKQNNAYSITYMHVQNAKKDLQFQIAVDPQRALYFTLDTMCSECSGYSGADPTGSKSETSPTSIDAQLRCVGTITSLFFFNQDDQDKMIIDRLVKASPEVLKWVADNRYEWFYNRPNPKRWIDMLTKISDHQLDQRLKDTMIKRINDAKHASEKFGVMLE